ncbi:methionyl-tRNA formyltransferase [soil metagenome]
MLYNSQKIVFWGTPSFVVPVLETLTKHFTVVGVVTTPDEKIGRHHLLTPTPVKQYCIDTSLQIPIFTPNTIQELNDVAKEHLTSLKPDLFVVAAYGKIIPDAIINLPRLGSINIHPSRLPDYKGPSPLQETILSGDSETAVTIIQMDADVDHGPILSVKPLAISQSDTFLTLATKAFQLGAKMLPETIEQLHKGEIIPQEQDHNKATFTSHITKQDGFFDSTQPPTPAQLDRMIRAYYPWPTAWTRLHLSSSGSTQEKILKFLPGNMLQVEGGRPMSLKDFTNGHPDMRALISSLILQQS